MALVTGAAEGLGLAIAQALADLGAAVVVSDRSGEGCEQAAADLRARGASATAVAADLLDPAQLDALAGRDTPVDVLVCSAGIAESAGPARRENDAEWNRALADSLRAAVQLSNRVIPRMAAAGQGSVVLVSSVARLRGKRPTGLYGMSRAALGQLTRSLALRCGPQGVRVNAVCPGLIRTRHAELLPAEAAYLERKLRAVPLRRVGEPSEVAGVVAMLASAAGAYVTGQLFVVDGGSSLGDGT